jgi:hypothetical protein
MDFLGETFNGGTRNLGFMHVLVAVSWRRLCSRVDETFLAWSKFSKIFTTSKKELVDACKQISHPGLEKV